MAFTVKDWQDSPSTATPLTAAAIEDLEQRLFDAGVPRIVVGGSLGATPTLALNGDKRVWMTGTLTANATLTVSGLSVSAAFLLLFVQDGTGGRTLTVSDGTNSQAVTGIPTTAGAAVFVSGYSPNGTDIWLVT